MNDVSQSHKTWNTMKTQINLWKKKTKYRICNTCLSHISIHSVPHLACWDLVALTHTVCSDRDKVILTFLYFLLLE